MSRINTEFINTFPKFVTGISNTFKDSVGSIGRLHKISKNGGSDGCSVGPESIVIDALDGSEETLNPSCPENDLFFNTTPAEAYQSAKPLLALLRAYECKVYYEYEFDPSSDGMWFITLQDRMEDQVLVRSLVLEGGNMVLEGDDFDTLQVRLLNGLWNSNREIASENETNLSFDNGKIILYCNDIVTKKHLEKLQLLSIFEYISIYKALTGSVISSVGIRMPDMHLILSSAFNFKDWCEVYLEGHGWVKLWCYIKRIKKKFDGKSRHRINFYKDDKCNELVCYVPETDCVEVFFCDERNDDSPRYREITSKDLLDSFTTIKLIGEVCFLPESRNFLRSLHSRTFSLKTKASFINMLTRPKKITDESVEEDGDDGDEPSVESTFSPEHSNPKDSVQFNTRSGGLLIRPLVHEGLSQLESMIRFILPVMDRCHKYGRPVCFENEKSYPESLMFGLPRLPSVDYFALEEKDRILEEQLPENSGDITALAMSHFVFLLNDFIQKNPDRESQFHFRQLSSALAAHSNEGGNELLPQDGSKSKDEEFLVSASNSVKLA